MLSTSVANNAPVLTNVDGGADVVDFTFGENTEVYGSCSVQESLISGNFISSVNQLKSKKVSKQVLCLWWPRASSSNKSAMGFMMIRAELGFECLKTLSKVSNCQLNRVADLAFTFFYGGCATTGSSVLLCFDEKSGLQNRDEFKTCRLSSDPIHSEWVHTHMTEFEHRRTRVGASKGFVGF